MTIQIIFMDSQKKVLNVKRACHTNLIEISIIKLQISLNGFRLVVIPIEDISNYNSTSHNSIRDIFK